MYFMQSTFTLSEVIYIVKNYLGLLLQYVLNHDRRTVTHLMEDIVKFRLCITNNNVNGHRPEL